MTGRSILALVGAIVVGYVLIKVLFWLLGAAFTLLSWLVYGAVVAAVVYVLYRAFNHMLTSGKRLT